MNAQHLKGLIAAPFTPMNSDGSINTELIYSYYKLLKVNAVNGAFICGSTGEGVSLTFDEKKSIAEAWAEATENDPDFTVMMFLGGTSIAECKKLALHAYSIGIEAISFTAPFYFKPATVEMLAKCCAEIACTVPQMPFYYYHIPVLTGVNFPMVDLLKVIDGNIPNFAGIKYTHEDLMDFLSCLHFKGGQYDMLWGRDESLLSALVIGAQGSVGSTFNYAAPLYNELIEAFKKNDLARARDLQQKSIDMIRLLGKYGGIATGKAYMKLVDLDCGEFRLPVKNMSADEFELFRGDTEQINFKNFCVNQKLVSSLEDGDKI
jgi:N-acetylneuraminate lyase